MADYDLSIEGTLEGVQDATEEQDLQNLVFNTSGILKSGNISLLNALQFPIDMAWIKPYYVSTLCTLSRPRFELAFQQGTVDTWSGGVRHVIIFKFDTSYEFATLAVAFTIGVRSYRGSYFTIGINRILRPTLTPRNVWIQHASRNIERNLNIERYGPYRSKCRIPILRNIKQVLDSIHICGVSQMMEE